MEDVEIYSAGVICMSVCSSLSPEETVKRVNEISPTGIEADWNISESKTFRDGSPNPSPCERDSNRKHYLLNC